MQNLIVVVGLVVASFIGLSVAGTYIYSDISLVGLEFIMSDLLEN